jgi:hypothetical protein
MKLTIQTTQNCLNRDNHIYNKVFLISFTHVENHIWYVGTRKDGNLGKNDILRMASFLRFEWTCKFIRYLKLETEGMTMKTILRVVILEYGLRIRVQIAISVPRVPPIGSLGFDIPKWNTWHFISATICFLFVNSLPY